MAKLFKWPTIWFDSIQNEKKTLRTTLFLYTLHLLSKKWIVCFGLSGCTMYMFQSRK